MLLKVYTIITILMFCSRPCIMPLADQDKKSPGNTVNEEGVSKEILAEVFESYSDKPEGILLKDFELLSCCSFEESARLDYYRETDKKDEQGNPQVEFLLILFKLTDEEWKIDKIRHIFLVRPKEKTYEELLDQILENDKAFCLPDKNKENSDQK